MGTKKVDSSKRAGNVTVTRYITYEQLHQDPNFPKGRLGYIGWFFKNMWQGIKRGFPKNLLLVLGIGLFYWMFNLVFLGIINDSCFFGNGRFSRSSTIAYLFAGLVYENGAKGFDWIPGGSMTTWFYNLTFYGALFWLLGNIWRRIRTKGILMPIKDLLRVPGKLKKCWVSVTVPFAKRILLATGLGILAGFVLKSPFTLITLALWLFLSFGQGGESSIIYLLFIYQGAKNVKSKKPKKLITGADVAIWIFGLGLGMLLSFILCLVLWHATDYSMTSRLLCFLPLGVLLVFFGLGGKISMNKAQQAVAGVLICFGYLYVKTMVVRADDGGWTESGRNIPGWLANPGTHLMAEAGLGSPAGMIAAWLGNMVGNAVLDHVTAGLGSAVASAADGAMQNGPLGLGLGAMNSALGPLGPVGDMISNAWSSSIDALAGGGGSGSSGSWGGGSGSSGGSGSWGGGSGGSGNSGNSGNWGNSSNSGNSGNWGDSGNSADWGNSGNSGSTGNSKPDANENNNHKPDLNDPNWRDQL